MSNTRTHMNRNKITEENWEMQISKKVFKNNEAILPVPALMQLVRLSD